MVFSQILVLRPRPQETSCLILTYFAKRSIFYAGSWPCSCLKKVPQDADMKNLLWGSNFEVATYRTGSWTTELKLKVKFWLKVNKLWVKFRLTWPIYILARPDQFLHSIHYDLPHSMYSGSRGKSWTYKLFS